MGFSKEVDFVINLIRETAKREILPRFGIVRGEVKEEFRDFKEVVTEADIESSKNILKILRLKFPGSYSEEELFEDRFSNDLIWQIDPVDGTSEFCAKMSDGYAMHAALLEKQRNGKYRSVAGIIYLPGVNNLWSFDGKKVKFFNNGKEKELPSLNNRELIGYIRKVDPNNEVKDFYQELSLKLHLPIKIIESGGSGSSFSDLLEGKINLVVMNYDYTKEWDVAMAEPIIKARGGWICDFDGNEFDYNRKDYFNRKGYVSSIVFKKEDIIPLIRKELLIKKL